VKDKDNAEGLVYK